MKKKLEKELIDLAHDILKLEGKENIHTLYSASRKLYEKITVLKFIESEFIELQQTKGSDEIENRFEKLANSVLYENRHVPESNPHENEDELMTPGIDTIKDMVKEMPKRETLDEILADVMPNPTFVKSDAEIVSPKERDIEKMHEKREVTLNNKFNAGIKIGLNDRLAFVKHLFHGNTDDFNRVISQLNSFQNEEEAREFIETRVKPDHKNWEGKEEYEHRFLKIVEACFN